MLTIEEFIVKCKSKGNQCVFFKNYDPQKKVTSDISTVDDAYYDQLNHKKGTRLSITLGPVIKLHSRKASKKEQFKNNPTLYSLLKIDNIVIGPKETISVLSNEYVALDGNTTALIFPRLSLVDVGLSLIPTYVDAYWKGILQMTIVNNTSKSISLNTGDSIGVIFFFDIKKQVEEKYKTNFPIDSHHYGQTWEKIINSDVEPFPTRKKFILLQLKYSLETS